LIDTGQRANAEELLLSNAKPEERQRVLQELLDQGILRK
jgi:hypothetical protein